MNWKLVAAMCLGAGLLTACGSGQQGAAAPAPGAQKRGVAPEPEEESNTGAAAPGAPAPAAAPGTSPAGVIIHEKKDR